MEGGETGSAQRGNWWGQQLDFLSALKLKLISSRSSSSAALASAHEEAVFMTHLTS